MLPVVAAIVTHRRPAELGRLLRGLSESAVPLAGCVISDHAPGGETKSLAGQTRFPTIVLDDPSNPGPGAGWAKAAKAALAHFPEAAAIWYLDDDVVIPPDALGILLEEMARAGADSIAPLLTGTDGKLWAFPEPESPAWRGPIREAATPAEARAALGDAPVSFCWCTGACYLVKKTAIEKSGFHREDFWLLGEDLEYSMRLAGASRAVFTCKVSVPHLPPPAASPAAARKSDYVKFCSLLQNLTYLAFHAPHSRHMKRYLPGNYRRFFRTHALRPGACPESGVSRGGAEGPSPSRIPETKGRVPSRFRRILHVSRDAAACWWNGAVRGQPAGTVSGQALRQRISQYEF